MAKDQQVDRASFTPRFLDRMRNPPEYVDQELPTKTFKLFKRRFMGGTMIDSTHSAVNFGSIEFSGSQHEFSPGSYSLRITRQHMGLGSVSSGAQAYWHLFHSRLGTIDTIPFQAVARLNTVADPMAPVYSLGPGTITIYWRTRKGSVRPFSSLEGIF